MLGAAWLLTQALESWFDHELEQRGRLALSAAETAFVDDLASGDVPGARARLERLADEEHVRAAALCRADGTTFAASTHWPAAHPCAGTAPGESGRVALDGPAHLSRHPIQDQGRMVGYGLVLHDLAFVDRIETRVGLVLLGVFVVLALGIAAFTYASSERAWHAWTAELRHVLRGGASRAEFAPVMKDVRELVDRLAAEREEEGGGGVWTPQRLKDSLSRYLLGERVVVVANREPYIHERDDDGAIQVQHPASGLVTALEPVMRACSGVWVAHGAGSADRETVNEHDRVRVPPDEQSYVLRRVWLSEEEEQGYYYGFSNEGLWPLCHIAHTRPIFRSSDWGHYRRVNQRFADAACDEVDSDDAIILVQDYHFALAPRMIRRRLPRATILTFWHIPWPNFERFAVCPWSDEILDGLLGSSILGFHTQFHCNNFFDCVDRYLEARIDRELNSILHAGSNTLIRPYAISIDWPNRAAQEAGPAAECREAVRHELQLAPGTHLGVGIDRLDYTKGIEERLEAIERLLERHPEHLGRFTFLQVAAPSRSAIAEYQLLNDRVEEIVERVNHRFSRPGYQPIILRRSHHDATAVFRFYKAADLVYVSSLHDGMNLVAKEFVAARDDEQGVLVLSSFTGASRELTEALIVNPYDLDEAADALAEALAMPEDEQRARMRTMRRFVAEFNVYRWAARMLRDAERLRRRERLTGRFLGQGRELQGLET
jgi:trehalose 6-phosphate synthase